MIVRGASVTDHGIFFLHYLKKIFAIKLKHDYINTANFL